MAILFKDQHTQHAEKYHRLYLKIDPFLEEQMVRKIYV